MKLNVVDNVGSNYTTITKVVEYNSEDIQDLVGHKTMLRISSWEIEYYVDYDWYADYFGVLTNIWMTLSMLAIFVTVIKRIY